jgi:hypothetical protein
MKSVGGLTIGKEINIYADIMTGMFDTLPAPPPQKALPAREPATEAKASKPTKGQTGQESPVAKATHPMSTRQPASRAGGLRSGGGLGPTDTCVDLFNPSKT